MHAPRGMSLIDVIVGVALILVIFLALFGILRASVLVAAVVKDEAAADAIAQSQMEYIRSLPYSSVGTVGGIPAGTIAQNATTTEDGTAYGVRTFIDYYDDAADGTGTHDTNGITTDYKRIKISVTYYTGGKARTESLISIYAPPALETTVNGGTLQIIVVNSTGSPVPGATVQITNTSITPNVNLSTFSDSTGTVYLPGASPSTAYAVTVSKSGYSTAQTYARDSNNQNPTPGYLTVVKNQTTSSTFAIDLLGTLTLHTYSPIATSTFTDAFANTSKLTTLTNTAASGGKLTLSGGAGNYALNGSALSITSAPAYLTSWGAVTGTIVAPSGTTATVQVVDGTGALLPDSVLAGNSAGFSTFPINLYKVSTTTYPALALQANLATNATSTTPYLSTWSLSYQAGPIPLPGVSYTLTGTKTIGSTGAGAPIYKTTASGTTDNSGQSPLSLEYDSYSLSIPSYDVTDACDVPPYALAANTSEDESVILSTLTTNALVVSVSDSNGDPVSGATVTLSRTGYTSTVISSSCGAAYFGGLTAATTYTIKISKTGYTSNTTNNVKVSGHTFYAVSF